MDILVADIVDQLELYEESVESAPLPDDLVERFNLNVIVDMTDETLLVLDRAIGQYNIIKHRLRSIEVRLMRAMKSGRYGCAAGLEMQRDSTRGALCMYNEYIHRKIAKINGLQAYRAMHCRR